MTFTKRLKSAWKAYSVGALGLLGSNALWWPIIEQASNGAFGENARQWAVVILAVAGILGWAVPQPRANLNGA